MDITEVKQKINKTLKLVQEQETPNVRLIQECIDLIEDNGLTEVMEHQVNQLKMLHNFGSFLQDNSNEDIEDKNYLGEDNKKMLVFTVMEIEDGSIKTSLDTTGLQTLELFGCVPLLEKAIKKVIDKEDDSEDC